MLFACSENEKFAVFYQDDIKDDLNFHNNLSEEKIYFIKNVKKDVHKEKNKCSIPIFEATKETTIIASKKTLQVVDR